jgi:hypothetical protein
MKDHPLQRLEGSPLGEYHLHLPQLKRLHLSGWRGFTLALQDREGTDAQPPVVEGIYSAGGKDGVSPWMDISVVEVIEFGSRRRLNLRQAGLMAELFIYLAQLVPPGGHLMVSYEDADPLHRETDRALSTGIPPVLTPLGFLLFESGFRLVKNWYLSEGGYEGPRKLWGEKPPNRTWTRVWDQATARQLVGFFKEKADTSEDRTGIERWRKNARMIFAALDIADTKLLHEGQEIG